MIIQGTGDIKPTGIVGSHGGDMNIERLKELKAEFEEGRKYNDMHYMSTVNVTKTKIKMGETRADKYTWADF